MSDTPQTNKPAVTRREALKRMGLVAAATATVATAATVAGCGRRDGPLSQCYYYYSYYYSYSSYYGYGYYSGYYSYSC
jgi:hypothetical protein